MDRISVPLGRCACFASICLSVWIQRWVNPVRLCNLDNCCGTKWREYMGISHAQLVFKYFQQQCFRGFLELGILTAAKQGLMCQPLTGRSSGRRRFLKLGEVWESFAGNQFSLNYQILLHFLVSRTVLMKVATSLANQNPFYWWNRRGTMPHFWNYEINSEKLPGAHGKKYPYTIPWAEYGALVHKPRCALLRTTTRSACSSWLAPKRICSQRRLAPLFWSVGSGLSPLVLV